MAYQAQDIRAEAGAFIHLLRPAIGEKHRYRQPAVTSRIRPFFGGCQQFAANTLSFVLRMND